MKLWKKIPLMFVLSLLIVFPTITASATPEPRAASRYCKTCKAITPFVDCYTCKTFFPSEPYHCNACGATYNHWLSICPEWQATH